MKNKYNYFIDVLIFLLLLISCLSMVYTYLSFKEKGESQQLLMLVDGKGIVYTNKNLIEPYSFKKAEIDPETKQYTSQTLNLEASYASQLTSEYLDTLLNFDFLYFNVNEQNETHYTKKIREFFYNEDAFDQYKEIMKNAAFAKRQQSHRLFVSSSMINPMEIVNEGTFKSNKTSRTIQMKGTYYLKAFSTTDAYYVKNFKVEITIFLTRVEDLKHGHHYKIIQTTMEGLSSEFI